MSFTILLLLYTFVFIFSFIFIGFWQWQLRMLSILDKPNIRSSHKIPTPRGGGLGIYISFISGLFIFKYLTDSYDNNDFFLIFGASFVFWIGLYDDFVNTKKRWRLLVHFLSAIIGCIWLRIPFVRWLEGFEGSSIYPLFFISWIVSLVWFVNLFNFMDGINGIAGMETIFVTSIYCIILYLQDPINNYYMQIGILVFSTLGFLFWNFPRSLVFLGDCGSGFIGFILFSIGSWMVFSNYMEVSSFLILTSLFWVDASITLLFRFWSGENIFHAHNRHCYQILSRKWKSHSLVTIIYLCINIFVILPLIFWIESGFPYNWLLLILIIFCLTFINIYFQILEKKNFGTRIET